MEKRKGNISLGAVKGIRIYLHWSFFLLLVYLVVAEMMRGGGWSSAAQLVLLVLAVFATVVLHELGHALTAKRYGCRTRDIILLPIGGVARMDRLPEDPGQEIKVALAGPAVNFALAALIYLLFFRSGGLPPISELSELRPSNWWAHFFYANAVLAIFNLIPAFPMDGGRVMRGLLSFRLDRLTATRIAAFLGQVIAIIMVVAGLFSNPMLVFVGAFIFFGAQMESDYLIGRSLLKGVAVRDVLMYPMVSLPADAKLSDAMNLLLRTQATRFVVMNGDLPVGVIDRKSLLLHIEEGGPGIRVADCMRSDIPVSSPDEDLETVYRKMQTGDDQLFLVKEGDRFSGYVDIENLLEFMLLRKALAKRRKFEINP
ncbi:MAG: hypothetical protein RL021_302 [Bacteroidota bacterium]